MSTSSFRLAKSAMGAIVLLLISSEAIFTLKECDEKGARAPSEQCVRSWTRRGWKPKDSQTHEGKEVRCHLQVSIGERSVFAFEFAMPSPLGSIFSVAVSPERGDADRDPLVIG
jgi:hypothetical protein